MNSFDIIKRARADLIDRIREYRTEQRLSPSGLATKAGLHKNALRDMDRENWNPNLDTIEKIGRFIDDQHVEAAQ